MSDIKSYIDVYEKKVPELGMRTYTAKIAASFSVSEDIAPSIPPDLIAHAIADELRRLVNSSETGAVIADKVATAKEGE